jgi:hypothetical protein
VATAWIPRIAISSSDVGTYERILNSESDVTQLDVQHGINIDTVRVAIVAWCSLLGDSPLEHKPRKVINRFVNQLLADYKGVCACYADLSDRVSRLIYHDHDSRALITGSFIADFKGTPIFREYLRFHRERDPRLLRFILSFLEFGRKIAYQDENLNEMALRQWYEVEERLESHMLPDYADDSLRAIVHWMFSRGWSEGPFLPKHGSGSVAEKDVWGAQGKNEAFRMDQKLSYMYERLSEIELSYSTPTGAAMPSKDVRQSISKLMFVPKDLKKTRSICMEPIDFMWAQQGVRLWYERWLADGVLGRHVDLQDQTKNQIMCWHGSISSDLATIDLSSASDSVSLRLVKKIFPPKVLKHLLATRSRFVDTGVEGDNARRVQKFAPMGSALCFPVQCTVFSAVVLLVSVAQTYNRNIWEGDSIADIDLDTAYRAMYGRRGRNNQFIKFQIYGDDMICDKRILPNVVRTLVDLGFQVNTDKSYVDEVAYRESCGVHCFNGFDVTPLKLKTKTLSQRMSLEAAIGIVDAANRSMEYGYRNLYSTLVNVALRYPIEGVEPRRGLNPILFVPCDSDESFAIRTTVPRNDHLIARKYRADVNSAIERLGREAGRRMRFTLSQGNKPRPEKYFGPYRPWPRPEPNFGARKPNVRVNFQKTRVKSLGIGPMSRREASEKFDAYYHTLWWRARYSSNELPVGSTGAAKADTKEVRARWRWTAAW